MGSLESRLHHDSHLPSHAFHLDRSRILSLLSFLVQDSTAFLPLCWLLFLSSLYPWLGQALLHVRSIPHYRARALPEKLLSPHGHWTTKSNWKYCSPVYMFSRHQVAYQNSAAYHPCSICANENPYIPMLEFPHENLSILLREPSIIWVDEGKCTKMRW